MNATCWPFSIASTRGEDGNNRFARAHVALQQAIHRMRPLHVVADVLERLPLPAREVERKHGAQRFPNAVVHLVW